MDFEVFALYKEKMEYDGVRISALHGEFRFLKEY